MISQISLFLLVIFVLETQADKLETAKRIIALSPHAVEMLYAIGAGEKIVATLEYANYPDAALKIPRIGNYSGVQIERVIELKPDLIVAWRSGNKIADLEKLESLGFNLVYSQPKKITDITNDLRKLGKLTGHQHQSEQVSEKLEKKYQQILNRYKNKTSVDVFYQLWHDPLQTAGANNWTESLIRDCGGKNIFNDSVAPYPTVSIESVLVKNPKVIIIPHHSGNIPEKKVIWSKWPEISAVNNDRIFTINADLLNRFTPRSLYGLEVLCEKIDQARE